MENPTCIHYGGARFVSGVVIGLHLSDMESACTQAMEKQGLIEPNLPQHPHEHLQGDMSFPLFAEKTIEEALSDFFLENDNFTEEELKRVANRLHQPTHTAAWAPDLLRPEFCLTVILMDIILLQQNTRNKPDKDGRLIWIDAHADLHSPYTSPSGNIHGMPLAAALSEDNMDCKINTVTSETEEHWTGIKNIGSSGAKVKPEDLIFFGVRDTEDPEDKQIEKLGIKNYKVSEVRHRTLSTCVDEAIEKLKDCDNIYISFDVDSMDCDAISYGTGTPVPKGFDQYEVIQIINQFLETKKVVCLEFVEVNPLLDTKGNKMAETAFEVLDNVTRVLQETLN